VDFSTPCRLANGHCVPVRFTECCVSAVRLALNHVCEHAHMLESCDGIAVPMARHFACSGVVGKHYGIVRLELEGIAVLAVVCAVARVGDRTPTVSGGTVLEVAEVLRSVVH